MSLHHNVRRLPLLFSHAPIIDWRWPGHVTGCMMLISHVTNQLVHVTVTRLWWMWLWMWLTIFKFLL